MRLNELIKFVECEFADIKKQSDWDNSGIQLYLGDVEVKRIYLALDLTDEVLNDAIKKGCEVIITHHPVFFAPSKSLDIRRESSRLVLKATQHNINILSYHTNLDISKNGINNYIAQLIDAEILKYPLTTVVTENLYKIQTFIPVKFKEKLIKAINEANKTTIGSYIETSFSSVGEGRFTAVGNANPFIGKIGINEVVDEVKVEITVDKQNLATVITTIKKTHPYEEVVTDVVRLEGGDEFGFGLIAKLNKKYTLPAFVKLIKSKLKVKGVRTNIESVKPFDIVAISSGSSVSSYKDCVKHGVSVLLTGDMKHHDAIDAYDAGVCVIDATHQYTEMLYMKHLGEVIRDRFGINFFVGKERDKIINWG